MKIKVLHYLSSLDLGGTSKTCQLFSDYLNRNKFDSYVAYNKDADNPRLDLFKRSADCVFGLKGPRDGQGLQYLIDSLEIDILHVYQTRHKDEFPAPGKDIKVPHFVVTNVFGFIDPNLKIERDLFMSKWLMDYTIRNIAMSSMHPWKNRFDFINNPVELPQSRAVLPIRNLIKNDKAILLGRCGRPDNGIYNSVSVDAARLLRAEGYDIRFVVVAPPSNMIEDLAKYDIPFHITDPTTDPIVLSKFYNTIDIYAHARADGETFGVNIAEAMIHSKPVVTHVAMPSFPGMGVFQAQTQIVEHGVTGFVVTNNAAAYADALKKLIDNKQLRDEYGMAGFSKAKREFTVDICVEKLEAVYEALM